MNGIRSGRGARNPAATLLPGILVGINFPMSARAHGRRHRPPRQAFPSGRGAAQKLAKDRLVERAGLQQKVRYLKRGETYDFTPSPR